ncbi:MAG: hypothetical protein GY927_17250 [bacterium]|nr:hypothetical protein [bacterium]
MNRVCPSSRALLFGFFLATTSIGAQAASINFSGQLDFIETDDGGVYHNAPFGTVFSGVIDDVSFNGSITDGTTLTSFGCCIAAGGLGISNDVVLSGDDANFLNSVLGKSQYSAGELVDGVDIEGDAVTSNGGRIEVGLSYILDSNSFNNTNPSNYPFDPTDVEVALFFVLEENSSGIDIYSAGGLINPIPLPAAAWLFGSALGLLGFTGWKKKKAV